MGSLDMNGPWELTTENIDAKVTRKEPGNYALSRRIISGKQHVDYVGRSDDDLSGRLHDYIGGKYTHFWAAYASSSKAAFDKECQNWHDFHGPEGELDNDIHPRRPDGQSWKCPVDGCEYSDKPKKSVW